MSVLYVFSVLAVAAASPATMSNDSENCTEVMKVTKDMSAVLDKLDPPLRAVVLVGLDNDRKDNVYKLVETMLKATGKVRVAYRGSSIGIGDIKDVNDADALKKAERAPGLMKLFAIVRSQSANANRIRISLFGRDGIAYGFGDVNDDSDCQQQLAPVPVPAPAQTPRTFAEAAVVPTEATPNSTPPGLANTPSFFEKRTAKRALGIAGIIGVGVGTIVGFSGLFVQSDASAPTRGRDLLASGLVLTGIGAILGLSGLLIDPYAP